MLSNSKTNKLIRGEDDETVNEDSSHSPPTTALLHPERAYELLNIVAPLLFTTSWLMTGTTCHDYQGLIPNNFYEEMKPVKATSPSGGEDTVRGKVLEHMLMRLISGETYQPPSNWLYLPTIASKKVIMWWQTLPQWAQDMTLDMVTDLKRAYCGEMEEEHSKTDLNETSDTTLDNLIEAHNYVGDL